jgi:predicted unusual protein kinase regulating ubiquinone biosynthesis (AarF/ABC1/UbiB family)
MRLLRAYRTLVVVLSSYLWHNAWALVRGSAWDERTLPDVHRRNAQRVERTIVRIQGLFIKVGQLISILTNFLPEEFRAELEGLQDQIPARPLGEVERRIERELGSPAQTLFAWFDPEPLASASLAQVHEARLHDGRRVAVKVQHADIERTAKSDLGAIRVILAVIAAVTGIGGLRRVFPEVRAMILGELDFVREADNLRRIAANFAAGANADGNGDGQRAQAGAHRIAFPEALPELSTARVLTATFVEGIKISDVDALRAAGLEPRAIAERVVRAYCEMVFSHGLYHADPHPGNILVQPGEGGAATLAFLDFGAVAELSSRMKEGIPRFLDAVLRRDPAKILAALRSMGFIARGSDEEVAERVIAYVQSRFLEEVTGSSWSVKDVQVDARAKLEALGDLKRMEVSFQDLMAIVDVPREWILIERTNLLLLGLCTHLDPRFNPFTVIRPYLKELLQGADGNLVERFSAVAKEMALAALSLPTDLGRLVGKTQRGDLEVRLRGLRESAELLYALGHQLLWTACAMFCGVFAWQAHQHGDARLTRWATGAGIAFLLLLAGALLRGRRLRRRPRR